MPKHWRLICLIDVQTLLNKDACVRLLVCDKNYKAINHWMISAAFLNMHMQRLFQGDLCNFHF